MNPSKINVKKQETGQAKQPVAVSTGTLSVDTTKTIQWILRGNMLKIVFPGAGYKYATWSLTEKQARMMFSDEPESDKYLSQETHDSLVSILNDLDVKQEARVLSSVIPPNIATEKIISNTESYTLPYGITISRPAEATFIYNVLGVDLFCYVFKGRMFDTPRVTHIGMIPISADASIDDVFAIITFCTQVGSAIQAFATPGYVVAINPAPRTPEESNAISRLTSGSYDVGFL